MPALPPILDRAAFRAIRADVDAQRAAFVCLAERHGLAASELIPFARGTHLVWGTRAAVLKAFVPLWPEDAVVEAALLDRLAGTDLAVPQLLARGTLDGWAYLVMSRLGGDRIGDVWPRLDSDQRTRLAREMGTQMARLHTLDPGGLERLRIAQDALIAERLPRLLTDQEERGASPELVNELAAWARALPELAPARQVLLHADLTDDHFLVDGARVTGIIDFADAFVGPWTYELAAPACFTTRSDPSAQHALLQGYGVDPHAEIGTAVRAWAVLHRYAHIATMMDKAGAAGLERWLETVWEG